MSWVRRCAVILAHRKACFPHEMIAVGPHCAEFFSIQNYALTNNVYAGPLLKLLLLYLIHEFSLKLTNEHTGARTCNDQI